MNLIEQSAKLIEIDNPIDQIAHCARVCYNAQEKKNFTHEENVALVRGLIKSGHTAMLEHARIEHKKQKFNVPITERASWGINSRAYWDYSLDYFSVNCRDAHLLGIDIFNFEKSSTIAPLITVQLTTSIALSRELCRHRIMSFAERSTRYCNLSGGIDFIKPTWFGQNCYRDAILSERLKMIEIGYILMVEDTPAAPQQARELLPLCTRTELIMSGTREQWDTVFALREKETATNKPHPEMMHLMSLVRAVIDG